ncbi:hypothetical protein T261_7843 [Streptomyces lydicus]|nr:hypothetical protein T261_7843 [Streptomyces lydicus]
MAGSRGWLQGWPGIRQKSKIVYFWHPEPAVLNHQQLR